MTGGTSGSNSVLVVPPDHSHSPADDLRLQQHSAKTAGPDSVKSNATLSCSGAVVGAEASGTTSARLGESTGEPREALAEKRHPPEQKSEEGLDYSIGHGGTRAAAEVPADRLSSRIVTETEVLRLKPVTTLNALAGQVLDQNSRASRAAGPRVAGASAVVQPGPQATSMPSNNPHDLQSRAVLKTATTTATSDPNTPNPAGLRFAKLVADFFRTSIADRLLLLGGDLHDKTHFYLAQGKTKMSIRESCVRDDEEEFADDVDPLQHPATSTLDAVPEHGLQQRAQSTTSSGVLPQAQVHGTAATGSTSSGGGSCAVNISDGGDPEIGYTTPQELGHLVRERFMELLSKVTAQNDRQNAVTGGQQEGASENDPLLFNEFFNAPQARWHMISQRTVDNDSNDDQGIPAIVVSRLVEAPAPVPAESTSEALPSEARRQSEAELRALGDGAGCASKAESDERGSSTVGPTAPEGPGMIDCSTPTTAYQPPRVHLQGASVPGSMREEQAKEAEQASARDHAVAEALRLRSSDLPVVRQVVNKQASKAGGAATPSSQMRRQLSPASSPEEGPSCTSSELEDEVSGPEDVFEGVAGKHDIINVEAPAAPVVSRSTMLKTAAGRVADESPAHEQPSDPPPGARKNPHQSGRDSPSRPMKNSEALNSRGAPAISPRFVVPRQAAPPTPRPSEHNRGDPENLRRAIDYYNLQDEDMRHIE
ncbi:unnamed protein product [Amoebophrya sp. A120]|nr:unnamed protein product [Amoebophrya sp. A120]|eukprot:GSA120T00011051001.1